MKFDDILFRYCNNLYNQNTMDQRTNGCIPPFPKKSNIGKATNYRDKILTSIAAKIYNALLRNRIESKIEKIFRKNQNGFRRNRSTTSQILTIRRILKGVRTKKPSVNTIICRLLQGIWLHTQRDNGANTSRLRTPQRNRCIHNDAI